MNEPHDLSEAELEQARTMRDQLATEAPQIGLFPREAAIGRLADGRTAVIMDFAVGNLAFADRIQDPDTERDRDATRALEADVVREAGIGMFLDLHDRLRGEHDV